MRFNVPIHLDKGIEYMKLVMESNQLCGDGKFTGLCHHWMEEKLDVSKVLLTTSGTSALEMAALLCNIEKGDEVIMPSYTFVSTANAFVLRGARIKFVDIRPDTMNMDEKIIEDAITDKTKAIVPVHYAGVSCEMDEINALAKKYNLYVIEDAAQALMARYKGKSCGALSDLGCFSFHETKNYTMGEGGAISIKDKKYIERAEIIREKGTNRSRFFRGEIDKYSWVEFGSSYLPSEFNAAYLYAQLEIAQEINDNRLKTWHNYYLKLKDLEEKGNICLAHYPEHCEHNAHMFWIKVEDLKQRKQLLNYLKDKGIGAVFHYVPLHSSEAGKKYGDFVGKDIFTTKESERIVRLPLYYDMKKEEIDYVCSHIYKFFQ